jgi:hypothetical protein
VAISISPLQTSSKNNLIKDYVKKHSNLIKPSDFISRLSMEEGVTQIMTGKHPISKEEAKLLLNEFNNFPNLTESDRE